MGKTAGLYEWIMDAEGASGLVGRTKGADVAAPFAASFADPNGPAPHKLTTSASFTDRLGSPERTKHVSVR
jgi:hypothetical protein